MKFLQLQPFYIISIALIYITYILIFLGVLSTKPSFIVKLSDIIQIFVCVFLIIRFHPFKSHYSFTDFDEKVIFGMAILLLSNLGIMRLFEKDIKNHIPSPRDWVNKKIKQITGNNGNNGNNGTTKDNATITHN